MVTASRRVAPELSAISPWVSVSLVAVAVLTNVKSPLTETPASASVTPVPVTRSVSPAVELELGVEAVERERLVDLGAVVLSSRPSVPCSVTLGTFCSATVPSTRPATPRRAASTRK